MAANNDNDNNNTNPQTAARHRDGVPFEGTHSYTRKVWWVEWVLQLVVLLPTIVSVVTAAVIMLIVLPYDLNPRLTLALWLSLCIALFFFRVAAEVLGWTIVEQHPNWSVYFLLPAYLFFFGIAMFLGSRVTIHASDSGPFLGTLFALCFTQWLAFVCGQEIKEYRYRKQQRVPENNDSSSNEPDDLVTIEVAMSLDSTPSTDEDEV